jgi:hypothetical protein
MSGLATVPAARSVPGSCLVLAAASAVDLNYDGMAVTGSEVRQMTHLACLTAGPTPLRIVDRPGGY